MEVILLEDVKSLGKKGQIVKINDGYARNFVLPKKLGLEATPKNLNDLKLQKAREAKEAAEELQLMHVERHRLFMLKGDEKRKSSRPVSRVLCLV